MTKTTDQKGFTLVELAIVMIIIGLLIGGILKGQELITNAQVASTVTQMKGIDAAISTFRDSYAAMPGDMDDATTRLPGCNAAPNCGDNPNLPDGRINGVSAGQAPPNVASENAQVWLHLSAADLLGGVQDTNAAGLTFGEIMPAGNVGGGFFIGYHQGGAQLPGQQAGPNPRGGHYISLSGDPGGNVGSSSISDVISASQAARIDRKVDDGTPGTGSVVAASSGAAAGNCIAPTDPDAYDEANDSISCAIHFRIQQ
jgi:prepilin-type N-terminal cleavage/methylation domain-containing protein